MKLAAAVRFDRTPEACVDELRRLAASKSADRPSRGLVLSEIHGMAGARAHHGWAPDIPCTRFALADCVEDSCEIPMITVKTAGRVTVTVTVIVRSPVTETVPALPVWVR